VRYYTDFGRRSWRWETKADGPFVVGGIMVDEGVKEGDVG
jgi:hypothetical protein